MNGESFSSPEPIVYAGAVGFLIAIGVLSLVAMYGRRVLRRARWWLDAAADRRSVRAHTRLRSLL